MKRIIMNKYLIFGLTMIMFSACQKNNNFNVENFKTVNQNNKNKGVIIYKDTLYKLLENSILKDSFEYSNQDPFLYIKVGNIFPSKFKSSVLVSCPNSTSYKIELYSLIDNVWVKKDEIDKLEVPNRQYQILLNDYNFDGYTDIYLNSNSSMGISMSTGHLLTFNYLKNKFDLHPETRKLKNMFPNAKNKTVIIDSIGYNEDGKRLWNLFYKWENGKLINTKVKVQTDQIY